MKKDRKEGKSMKKIFVLILIFIFLCMSIFAEELNMNQNLESGMEYILTEVIPKYYNGQRAFKEERDFLFREYMIMIQGEENFFDEMRGTEDLIFSFFYFQDSVRQIAQVIMITSEEYENELYEYWIVKISDNGTPYNYAYFYLTKAESKTSEREIINISKKYRELYTLQNGVELDLTFRNLISLYQSAPELKLESFKDTKYENMIVKWKKDEPYLRKMNIFEILYYRLLPKAKRG